MTANEAINSGKFTESEICIIKWQFGLYGSFYTNLFVAIQSADPINLRKLEKGFPVEVAGFKAWQDESNALANKIDEVIGL